MEGYLATEMLLATEMPAESTPLLLAFHTQQPTVEEKY